MSFIGFKRGYFLHQFFDTNFFTSKFLLFYTNFFTSKCLLFLDQNFRFFTPISNTHFLHPFFLQQLFFHQNFCFFYKKIFGFFTPKFLFFLHENFCFFYNNFFYINGLHEKFCFLHQFFYTKF